MFSTTEITSHEITSDNPVHQRLVFAYAEAAPRLLGQVLEIGCGVGRGLAIIAEHTQQYTAIDKNEKLIHALQQQYPHFRFITQHIPPLTGLADNSFDTIISFQVIEHIEDDNTFVREIHRVLRAGGQAIITTPNRTRSLTRNPWHVREYTAEELGKLLHRYFDTVEMYGVQGNDKVNAYFERNKAAVERITRWDIFNLQYRLPRRLLQIPYDLLNRFNRRRLQSQNRVLVADIDYTDYSLTTEPTQSLDLFYIVRK